MHRSRTPAEHATRAHHPVASLANADNVVHHDGTGPARATGMPSPAASPAAPWQPQREPTLSELLAAVQGGQEVTHTKLDALTGRLDVQGHKIDELAERTGELEATTTRLATTAGDLERRVAALERAPSRAPSSHTGSSVSSRSSGGLRTDPYAFEPQIIRVTTAQSVPREAIKPALAATLDRAQVAAGSLRVAGPARGRRIVLRFKESAGGEAELVVAQIMDGRRLEDGSWHHAVIVGLGNVQIDMFLDRDRSLVQRKRNFHLNHLAKAICALHPSLEVSPHRAPATLVVAWQAIVQVVSDDATHDAALQWQHAAVKEAGLDAVGPDAERRRQAGAPVVRHRAVRAEPPHRRRRSPPPPSALHTTPHDAFP